MNSSPPPYRIRRSDALTYINGPPDGAGRYPRDEHTDAGAGAVANLDVDQGHGLAAVIPCDRTMKSLALLSLLAGASILFTGCGGSQNEATTATTAASPANGARVVEITANDAMKFSLSTINAQPGEKLQIVLKNTGRMPKQAMAHNWVLLKPMTDGEVNSFGMAAANKAPTYLPDDRSAILAATKMLGPNESDRVDVTVPSEAGEYPFLCTFPGHFAIMKGKLVVK